MPRKKAVNNNSRVVVLSLLTAGLIIAIAASWLKTFRNPQDLSHQTSANQENVVGRVQSHEYNSQAVITLGNEYYSSKGGVIAISSSNEPSIYIRHDTRSTTANVSFYESNEDALVEYLIHDEEGNQINDYDTDSDNFEFMGETNVNVNDIDDTEVHLPSTEPGIYFVEVESGDDTSDSFIIVSENGAIAKEGDDTLIFWAQNFASGRKITNGEIELLSLLGGKRTLDTDSLDSNGIAETILDSDADAAILRSGDDFALIPINLKYLNSSWNWNPFQPYEEGARYFTFTDRPLYKPGDTVSYKSIIRADYDASYTIPTGSARITLTDGYEESVKIEQTVPISSNGAVNGTFLLPADAKPGYYNVSVTALNYTGENIDYWYGSSAYFQVEEYRKPEYTLSVTPKTEDIIIGDTLEFTISGNYFSGFPLAGQTVTYKIGNSDIYYTPYYYDEYDGSSYDYWGYYGSLYSPTEEGTVTLGQDGTATVSVDTSGTKWQKDGKRQVFEIEASFKDATQNDVLAAANLLAYPGEYQIFKRTYEYSSVVNQPLTLDLLLKEVRDTNLNGVKLSADVTLSTWEKKPDSSQKSGYRYENVITNITTLNTTSNAEGHADFTLTPKREGTYEFKVQGEDSKGRIIKNEFSMWVSDREYTYSRGDTVEINPNKKLYEPNETAKFTINSSRENTDLLLTVERGFLRRYQIVSIQGNKGEISLPLQTLDMPNIYVNVATLAGGDYLSGYSDIEVSPKSKQLNIDIKTDSQRYKPGDTVNIDITTTDINGRGVSSEVTLWAMDKALLELSGDNLGDIFDTFWSTRYNGTSVAHSLEGITKYGAEGGGGGGGDGDVRSIFKDTAYWNPTVMTDANGKSRVSFKLPDDLTTWVIHGVGASTSTIVGQNSTEVTAGKEFVIRPVLPNVLRENDKPRLSGIVNNYTSSEVEAEVSLAFDSGKINSSEKQTIKVAPNSQQQVYWDVTPEKVTPNAKITMSVSANNNLSDAVETQIAIEPFGYTLKHSEFGINAKDYSFKIDDKALNENTMVSLELASSLTGSLRSAMTYLVNYPYGCVEQTVSRLIPTIVASENLSVYSQYLDGKNLDKMLNVGINKLIVQQHNDGGWGWWVHLDSDPYVTAYVFEYLMRAQKLGYSVDSYAISRAHSYLGTVAGLYENYNQEPAKYDSYGDKVAASYALLMYSPYYADQETKLTPFNMNFMNSLTDDQLAMAVIVNYKLGVTDPKQNGLDLLVSRAEVSESTAKWHAGHSENFGSDEASTAHALKALVLTNGDKELAAKAVRYLVTTRTKSYWSNTFATALVIDSVTAYSNLENELNPNFSYKVSVNGKEIKNGQVNAALDEMPTIEVPAAEVKSGGNNIKVEVSGDGQLYSTLFVNQFIKEESNRAIDSGIKIKREYISERGPEYSLSPGDTVTVRLTLTGAKSPEISYLAIEDFLPSGLIPINTNLANQSGYFSISSAYSWEVSQSTRKDGVVLYVRNTRDSKNVYEYKARVVNSGEFYAPPARAEFMYLPEVYGISASDRITITDEPQINYLKLAKVKANQFVGILIPVLFYGIIALVLFFVIKFVRRIIRKRKGQQVENTHEHKHHDHTHHESHGHHKPSETLKPEDAPSLNETS